MHWGLKSLPMMGAVVLLSAADVSANGMRCNNKLVRPGDSSYQVKSLCGPPDDMQQRTEQRRVARAVERPCTDSPTGRCAFVVEDVIQVVIDEWTYDFGPQRFVQFLTFEAGKLLTVKSGGYGHKR
jgi:Protein of unknown function (DUF2845)